MREGKSDKGVATCDAEIRGACSSSRHTALRALPPSRFSSAYPRPCRACAPHAVKFAPAPAAAKAGGPAKVDAAAKAKADVADAAKATAAKAAGDKAAAA